MKTSRNAQLKCDCGTIQLFGQKGKQDETCDEYATALKLYLWRPAIMRSRKFLAEMNMYFKYFNDNAREKVLNGAPEDVNNLTFQRTASLSHQEIKTCKELRKLIYSVKQNKKITTT